MTLKSTDLKLAAESEEKESQVACNRVPFPLHPSRSRWRFYERPTKRPVNTETKDETNGFAPAAAFFSSRLEGGLGLGH